MIITNAQIESTQLGYEGHGILTIMIYLSYDRHASQGFGGYNLTNATQLQKWITGILRVLELEKWEDLNGKYIRVEQQNKSDKILRIGNLLQDKWFDPMN